MQLRDEDIDDEDVNDLDDGDDVDDGDGSLFFCLSVCTHMYTYLFLVAFQIIVVLHTIHTVYNLVSICAKTSFLQL